MKEIIAIANQKGGVGKTTTSINLASSLSFLGFSVLIVDMDPQGNATSGVGLIKRDVRYSSYDILLSDADIFKSIQPTEIDWLEIIPSSINLVGAEIELVSVDKREYRLRNSLSKVVDIFDYIIIDCPPSLGLITINSLVAANKVIVPIQCEYYALEGLGQLMNTISAIKKSLNNNLEIEGLVLTMYDPRINLSKQVLENVKMYFSGKIFKTIIPRNVKLSEAPSFGKPAILYDRQSRGAMAYLDLAKEFVGGI